MKTFRYLLMTASLLMSAQAGFAMSPSVASLQALAAAGQQQGPASEEACPGESYSLRQISGCLSSACPVMSQCPWFTYLCQHGVTTCQRLCSASGRAGTVCQPDSEGCEAACAGGNKACGAAGAASCCAKGRAAAQAQKCCCGKACACCEACKKKTAENSACEQACPVPSGCPYVPRFGLVWDSFLPPMPILGQHHHQSLANGFDLPDEDLLPSPGQHLGPWVLPVPSARTWIGPQPQQVPMWSFSGQLPMPGALMPRVIAVPAPGAAMMPIPFHVVRQAAPARNVTQAQHAHLVTPDLEAHCERMIHKGEMILLEGEVRLVSRKNGQHIRIEAHRVMLNMRDGTFTVESDVSPVRTSHIGVSRIPGENAARYSPYGPTSAIERATFHGIEVFPVPIPSYEVSKPTSRGEYVPEDVYAPR